MAKNNSWIVWLIALIAVVALIVAIIAFGKVSSTGEAIKISSSTKKGNLVYTQQEIDNKLNVLSSAIYDLTDRVNKISNIINQTNQSGILIVVSYPSGANISIDNITKGLTNYNISGLYTGNHQIKLSKVGYLDYSLVKYISPGSNFLSVNLTRINQTI